MEDVEVFTMIKSGTITYALFPFTFEILSAYGYRDIEIRHILADRYHVNINGREALLEFSSNYFINNYVEKNEYYRMLMGLPQ